MRVANKICNAIGFVSQWSAGITMWLIVVLIIIIGLEVVMRYAFNAPTKWQFDTSSMILATFVAVGFGYVHYLRGNVRVDVIYARLSPRGKLILDIIFTIIFSCPMVFLLATTFVQDAWYAYQNNETLWKTTWYPPAWPYKTMVALGLSILALQVIAIFVDDVITLIRGVKEP